MTKILDVSLKKGQITTLKKTTKRMKSLEKITSNYNKGKAYEIELKYFNVRDHTFMTSTSHRKVGKRSIV